MRVGYVTLWSIYSNDIVGFADYLTSSRVNISRTYKDVERAITSHIDVDKNDMLIYFVQKSCSSKLDCVKKIRDLSGRDLMSCKKYYERIVE